MTAATLAAAAAAGAQPAAAPGTNVAERKQPKDFPAMLEAWKPEIARALPKHLNADRMARIALTCFRAVPKLGKCDPRSVFAAVIQAAQLGIEPGLMGEAHLVPFGDSVQLIPGYQGLIKLAKQTGQVVDIYAMVVREKDKFSCRFGLNRSLEHDPLAKGGFPAPIKDRGEIIGVYAVAVFKDNSRTFVVMGRDEVDRIKENSSGYKAAKKWNKETPWDTHYEEMASKTAIRKLCKTLPKSPELAQAIALEDAHYKGTPQRLDLAAALDNSYSAPMSDDDAIEGQVIEEGNEPHQAGVAAGGASASGAASEAAPAGTVQQPQPEAAARRKKPDYPVSMKDVIAKVAGGFYDEARDIVRGAPYTDNDRAEVESNIKKHEAGGKV